MGNPHADTPEESEIARPGSRLVVGLQPVREAIRAHGKAVRSVLIGHDGPDDPNPRLQAVARFASDQGVAEVRTVRTRDLDRLTRGAQHQGVAAFAPELRLEAPEALLESPSLLAVALDGIQDPQNFGAVIRSAVGIAGAAVVWGEHGAAPLSLATFRASAGAIEHATLCRVRSLREFLQDASTRAVQIVGLDAQAEQPLRALDLTLPTVLLLGSEHAGLRRGTRKTCTAFARIVRPRGVDSLNASVAAAIALYEAQVQREKSAT